MRDKKPKRRRLALNDVSKACLGARASLTSLPIEILAEILLCTCSPPTVLAISRTCSFLYRSLALNPAASFIWRGVRKSFKPVLPDPGDAWKGSEADYATLVFGGGVCEVCKKTTRAMYVSFAARIRLCGSWHCRRKMFDEVLVDVATIFQGQDRQSIWAPYVESNLCFRPFAVRPMTWPNNDALLFRKTDFERFKQGLTAYRAAEQSQAKRECAVAPDTAREEDEKKRLMERCHADMQRFPEIMEVSARLIRWRCEYDTQLKVVKKQNQVWTKRFAKREGWNLDDLVVSQTYTSLLSRTNSHLERIELDDVSQIRSTIESELLALQTRHKRQKAESNYKERLTEVKKIYERMRCGTLADPANPTDAWILPPLSIFCTLPSVRALKGSPNPSAVILDSTSAAADIRSSSLATSLIVSDLRTWVAPVEKHLMGLLGYPNGWQSASTRTLPPLKRVTARFFCVQCGEGRVGRAYRTEQCLDLRGVCSHVCVAAQRKSIEGRDHEPDATDAVDGNAQEGGKDRGKKKCGVKTLDWKVDVFKKDEKAIRLIKKILWLKGLSEEDPSTALAVERVVVRCMTCQGWIVMDFETAIGHAHRHESMEIQLLPVSFPISVVFKQCPDALGGRPIPILRLMFSRGTSELLLGPSHRARNLCKKVNYGCKHCFHVDDNDGLIAYEKPGVGKGARAMDFNGLRSHVKEKHGIQDVRDEDFFGYEPISKD